MVNFKIGQLSKEQFFEKKWSKFNKKSFEVAVKAGLFDDWSNSREELINLKMTKIKDVKQYDLFTGEAGIQNIIKQKKYTLFNNKAICNEDVFDDKKAEYRRKVRISTGNFQNLNYFKSMLLPFWKGNAFAFLSHKVLRWLTPFFLIACLISSLFLAFKYEIFIWLFI